MEAACLGAESQKSAIDRGRLWRKGNYVFVRVRVERGRVGETSDTRGGVKGARRSGERPSGQTTRLRGSEQIPGQPRRSRASADSPCLREAPVQNTPLPHPRAELQPTRSFIHSFIQQTSEALLVTRRSADC